MRIRAGDDVAPFVTVFLNGVELKNCSAVDTGEGWAEVVRHYRPEEPIGDSWPIDRLLGRVEVTFKSDTPADLLPAVSP